MNFYHIGINMVADVTTTQALERLFSGPLTSDWIRYGGTNWIVWTDKNPQQLADALRQVLLPPIEFLVLQIDPRAAKQGYLKPWIWEWFNRPRPAHSALAGLDYPGLLSNYLASAPGPPPGPFASRLPPATGINPFGPKKP